MKDDLKTSKIIREQTETIRGMLRSVKKIEERAAGYIDLARKNNWKENKTLAEILKECERALVYVDCRAAELKQITCSIPEGQKRLVS